MEKMIRTDGNDCGASKTKEEREWIVRAFLDKPSKKKEAKQSHERDSIKFQMQHSRFYAFRCFFSLSLEFI